MNHWFVLFSFTRRLEMATGQTIPPIFQWNDQGTIKPIHPEIFYRSGVPELIPHDFKRIAVRNLERAMAPRFVAMKPTGHKQRRSIGVMHWSVRPT